MLIEVHGRNTAVGDEVREHVHRRFDKVARQVSELARLRVELLQERNPAIPDRFVAEATLYLKGTVLVARDASPDQIRAINLCEQELARQVKRYKAKRRHRREARAAAAAAAATSGVSPPA
jgi:putative sigma-54 modulation protein